MIPPDAMTNIGFFVFRNLFTPAGQMFIPPQLHPHSSWNEIERMSQNTTSGHQPHDWYTRPGEGGVRWFEHILLTIDNELDQHGKTISTLAQIYQGEQLPARTRAISIQTSPEPMHGGGHQLVQRREIIEVSSSGDDTESDDDDEEEEEEEEEEDEDSPPPKRTTGRRGRPKGSKNIPKPKAPSYSDSDDEPFVMRSRRKPQQSNTGGRGRGRPPGAKNKPKPPRSSNASGRFNTLHHTHGSPYYR
jgi:hypothetical protein